MAIVIISLSIVAMIGILGIRVLLQARQNGGLPDHMLGVYFVLISVGGIPGLLARNEEFFAPAHQQLAMGFGQGLLSLGFACLFIFVWKCFGATSRWRMVLALTGAASQIALYVALGVVDSYQPPGGAVMRFSALIRGGSILWAFCESLRCWLMMRKRIRLGLMDPVVSNRFLLWSLWTGSLLLANSIAIALRFVAPDLVLNASDPVSWVVISATFVLMSGSAGTLALAFFPTEGYLRWLRASPAECASA